MARTKTLAVMTMLMKVSSPINVHALSAMVTVIACASPEPPAPHVPSTPTPAQPRPLIPPTMPTPPAPALCPFVAVRAASIAIASVKPRVIKCTRAKRRGAPSPTDAKRSSKKRGFNVLRHRGRPLYIGKAPPCRCATPNAQQAAKESAALTARRAAKSTVSRAQVVAAPLVHAATHCTASGEVNCISGEHIGVRAARCTL